MPDVFALGDVVEFRSGDPRQPWKLGEVAEVFHPGCQGNYAGSRIHASQLRLVTGPRVHVIRPARLCRLVASARDLNAGGAVAAKAS